MVEYVRISHEEYMTGKWAYTAQQDGGYFAKVFYRGDGSIDESSYSTKYREELHKDTDADKDQSQNVQENKGNGFFSAFLMVAMASSEKRGKTKPITRHTKAPTLPKPNEPRPTKKAAPTPKRVIAQRAARPAGVSAFSPLSKEGTAKRSLLKSSRPAPVKPIRPAKPVASVSKKRKISVSSSRSTTSQKRSSGGMFGGGSKKKSGGMFGGGMGKRRR